MEPDSVLGNAILGTADSPVHAPDTFRDDLLHKYLDAASRTAVAQMCKAGLAWVLQDWAKDATLSVPVRATSAERAPELLRRLQRAKQQLDQRQSSNHSRPASIALQQQGYMPSEDTTWFHVPLSVLASLSPPSTLTLRLQRIPAALLECAGTAWPALASLSVEQLRGVEGAVKLPAPSALPALRRLTIGWVSRGAEEGLTATVGPYLQQLESLRIDKQQAPMSNLFIHRLFIAREATHTLRSLTVPFLLNPVFTRILQRCTPALKILGVTTFSTLVSEAETVSPVCSWSTLVCSNDRRKPHQALSWLPLPAEGMLVIETPGPGVLDVELPLSDTVSVVHHSLPACCRSRL